MNNTLALTPTLREKLNQICANYPVQRAALLPALHLIQETYGFITLEAEREVAEYFSIPLADVREVMTFYTLFHSKPAGACHIQICRTLSCDLRGAQKLISHLQEKLGIQSGETSADQKFSLSVVECLGACEIAPMAKVGKEFIGPLTIEKLDEMVESCSQ